MFSNNGMRDVDNYLLVKLMKVLFFVWNLIGDWKYSNRNTASNIVLLKEKDVKIVGYYLQSKPVIYEASVQFFLFLFADISP